MVEETKSEELTFNGHELGSQILDVVNDALTRFPVTEKTAQEYGKLVVHLTGARALVKAMAITEATRGSENISGIINDLAERLANHPSVTEMTEITAGSREELLAKVTEHIMKGRQSSGSTQGDASPPGSNGQEAKPN